MQKVIFPLRPGMQGSEVANLQDALPLLIDRGSIALSPDEQQVFARLFTEEKRDPGQQRRHGQSGHSHPGSAVFLNTVQKWWPKVQ
jgi:hypothetical protein